jgi:DNA-binding transcriptional LysR family regulator
LRYFVAVAEMENVSRAAMQRLHVSQPSLSRQIRDLEDEIGVQLLERTAKSVRLTDAGRAFLDEARAILKHADDAVGNVRAIAGKRETELHIGDWPLATGRITLSIHAATHGAFRDRRLSRPNHAVPARFMHLRAAAATPTMPGGHRTTAESCPAYLPEPLAEPAPSA